jgi:hypothetical protein
LIEGNSAFRYAALESSGSFPAGFMLFCSRREKPGNNPHNSIEPALAAKPNAFLGYVTLP